jgi:hypothetical protein
VSSACGGDDVAPSDAEPLTGTIGTALTETVSADDGAVAGEPTVGGDGWRLLGSGTGGQDEVSDVALDRSALARMIARYDVSGDAALVDFTTEAVAAVTIVHGGNCPPRLDRLTVSPNGDAITVGVSFPDADRGCNEDRNLTTFLVAYDQADLADRYTVGLESAPEIASTVWPRLGVVDRSGLIVDVERDTEVTDVPGGFNITRIDGDTVTIEWGSSSCNSTTLAVSSDADTRTVGLRPTEGALYDDCEGVASALGLALTFSRTANDVEIVE